MFRRIDKKEEEINAIEEETDSIESRETRVKRTNRVRNAKRNGNVHMINYIHTLFVCTRCVVHRPCAPSTW